jgi:cupin 2 domain-containing protein
MTITAGNIFDLGSFDLGSRDAPGEQLTALLTATNLRLERIVSHAHASPEGFWYDQEWAEWVIVLKGSAGLHFESESAPRVLKAGDYVDIPAHARHRVAWTDAQEPTVWLALHYR